MSLSAPEDAFLDVNDAHLRVYGNVHADGLKLGQLEIVTTTSTGSTIQFLHQHTAFTTTSNIEVGTTNHDLFVDTKNSRVGILTNTPTTALDVNGTVKATAFDGDGALLTGIPSSAINGTLSQWTTVTGPKIHYSDGNVGIGIADPLHTLDVVGDINFTGTLREDGNPFVSTPWTIESGPTALSYTLGNVGVGGTTPSAKLEVTGNAHVSTDLSVGGNLTINTISAAATHGLGAVTALSNTSADTVLLTNTGTSLVASGNVTVGGDLDISGNLGSSLVNLVYPIGAVYISVNSADPGTIWAGTTWVAFGEGRTLVGQGQGSGLTNRPTVEATGGAETHTLTENEMPSHTHSYTNSNSSSRNTGQPGSDHVGVVGASTGSTGGDQAHNNMQPFIVTYMWKRTA
jgi:microcystin-dependent protein